MSNSDFDEYERDEELLEARRLKRLEMKRKRKIQQRIILGVLAVVLVLAIVLIFKSCGKDDTPEKQPPVTPPVAEQEKEPAPTPEPDTKATLAAVGDIMMYNSQLEDAIQEDLNYDFSDCFKAVSPYTMAADLTVGNLELNMANTTFSGQAQNPPFFNAPSVLATNLKDIGFDILQTANTYSIMNGINGLTQTMNALTAAGIDSLGTHVTDPAESPNGGVIMKEVNGIKIAFLGFTKGLNGLKLPPSSAYSVDLLFSDYNGAYTQINTTAILNRIEAAAALEPDVIVAMVHWGGEYDIEIADSQKDISDLMFKNGVDVILGSHSHVAGPMEMRKVTTKDGEKKDCFVAYSLGNFVSDMGQRDYAMESMVLNMEFTKSGETGKTTISNVSYTPLYIVDHGENADLRFEVVPIRSAVQSTLFDDFKEPMTAALENLKKNTTFQNDTTSYDSGN